MLSAVDFKKLAAFRAEILGAVQAPNTRTAYRNAWQRFSSWCELADQCPLPASAETLVLYLTDVLLSGLKIESGKLYVSAINNKHKAAKLPYPDPPQIRNFLECAQRLLCQRPDQKQPLDIEHLRQICAVLSTSSRPRHIRDRAIITLGYITALRRSSLVDLDVEDLEWSSHGVVVQIRREKNDQMAQGRSIGVEPGACSQTDPIGALQGWLKIRGDSPGPLFRRLQSPHQRLKAPRIAIIVKEGILAIGLDPRKFAGHSTRSGFVGCCLNAGVDSLVVARTTGHRSMEMLRKYYREGDPFKGCVSSSMIGL